MNVKKGEIIVLYFIIFILFLPILLHISPYYNDVELSGVVVDENMPEMNWQSIMDGTYQAAVDDYNSNSLEGRGALLKLGNQMVYTVFHKSPSTRLEIGRGGNLFEKDYLSIKLQYKQPVTKEGIDELIGKLELLQQMLKKQGTKLFVFITPSKAEIYAEDIPQIYYKCAPEQKESSYELFINTISKSNIPYYDSVVYVNELKEKEKDVYGKTGTHWTQVTGIRVAMQLVKSIEEQFDYDLTEFTVTKEQIDTPMSPDADIYNLMNVMAKPKGEFYYPVISDIEMGSDQPSMICRGGSFMGQSIFHLIKQDIFCDAVYIENKYMYQNKFSDLQFFSEYSEIDLENCLDKDIMILEVNQASIDSMSFGFIDYLLESDFIK